MDLQRVVDKCVKGGALFRVADEVRHAKNVEAVFKAFGPNALAMVISVYGENCSPAYVWEDLAHAGFARS
jgi:hypothetical protein